MRNGDIAGSSVERPPPSGPKRSNAKNGNAVYQLPQGYNMESLVYGSLITRNPLSSS